MREKGASQAVPAIGITVLCIVVGFFLLLPYYLGPDDLSSCQDKPVVNDLNDACRPSDAIVAISGGDTAARTEEAIKLYKNGWAPKLIFSGAAQDKSGPSNAAAMKQIAIEKGVPEASILLEESSINTEENARNTQNLVKSNNLHRIVLVTSAYHQRRASLEFRKRAGNEIIVINHPVAQDKQWQNNWYETPVGWWLALGELIKVIGFYVS